MNQQHRSRRLFSRGRVDPGAILVLAIASLGGGGLLLWMQSVADDKITSLAAGAAFLICLWGCLYPLRLSPLSPAMVYLYVLAVFHLGLVVPWSLGLHTDAPPDWLIHHHLTPALFLVVVALMTYLAGAALAVWKWPAEKSSVRKPARYYNVPVFHCGLAVFVAGCAMFFWGIRELGFDRLLAATYLETYKLTSWYDPRFFVTSLNVTPIGLYLMAAAAPWRRIPLVLLIVIAWSGLIFWLGFRGFGLIPVITVFVVLNKRGFRLPRLAYVLGLAAVLFAIPAVTLLRQVRLQERSIIGALAQARPLAAVEEMGASLRPLVHTVHYMETEPLRRGKTYWSGLLGVMPNLSLDWQGRSYVPLEELPPSHWVTKQAAPWTYRHFGGLGFSAVAEPYMNFGTPGVVGFFLLLPCLLVWADRFDASRPSRLAMWAVLLGPLLWTTRNSFDNFFRPAAVGLICVFLATLVSSSLAAMGRQTRRRSIATPPALERTAGGG